MTFDLDKLLDTVDNNKMALLRNVGDVSRLQPSIRSESFGRGFGISPVPIR